MKIRISGNSMRFRLMQSEVQRFQQEGNITEVISFGLQAAEKLSFILKQAASNEFQIVYEANSVTLQIPPALCTKWTQTELVGFEETIDTGNGEVITILVEKDFKCLDGTDIENEDAYPNPNLRC